MDAAKIWNTIWLSAFIGGGLAIIVLGLIMYRCRLEIGRKGARSLREWIWWILVALIGYFLVLSFLRPGF